MFSGGIEKQNWQKWIIETNPTKFDFINHHQNFVPTNICSKKVLSQKCLSHSPKSSLSSQLLPASINIVSLNNSKMFMIEVLSSFMGSLQRVVESLYLFPDYLSLLSGVVLGYSVCTECSHAGKLTLQFLWIIFIKFCSHDTRLVQS